MTELVKFPSISKYSDVIQNVAYRIRCVGKNEDGSPVFDGSRALPTLALVGRVKLHGTNASVVFHEDGSVTYQSRDRKITPLDDNMGFARFMSNELRAQWHQDALDQIKATVGDELVWPVTVYGEWCGGSIQGGVALSKTEKMFVVFKVRFGHNTEDDIAPGAFWGDIDDYEYLECRTLGIYHTNTFGKYLVIVDFNQPQQAVQYFDSLTQEIEAKCPAGAFFGVVGIGEGLVWTPEAASYQSSRYWFKTKGDKHKEKKSGKDTDIDPDKQAKLESAAAIVDEYLVENRLLRGISHMAEAGHTLDRKSTGEFVKWIVGDILKDSVQDMIAADIDSKAISSNASKKVSAWYFTYLDKQQGL